MTTNQHSKRIAWNKGMKFPYKPRPKLKGKEPWNKLKEPRTVCIKCGEGMAESRKRPYCKPCRNEYARKNYSAEKDRRRKVKYYYGITIEDYIKQYKIQKGRCKICNTPKEVLDIDHDHSTNAVRALLCRGCNVFVGRIESHPELIAKVTEYLNYHGKRAKK